MAAPLVASPLVDRVVAMLPAGLPQAVGPVEITGELARFATADAEVVVALTSAAADRLRQEEGFVARFAPGAPVAMPAYREVIRAADPRVVLRAPAPRGHRVDVTDPSSLERLAPALAAVIDWLAALDAQAALEAGVRLRTASYHNTARCYRDAATAYAAVGALLDDRARASAARLFATTPLPVPERDPPRLLHPRLVADTLGWDADRLAIRSWGEVGFGDRAVSLVRPWLAGGEEFLAAIAAHLAWADERCLATVRFLGRCAALIELAAARDRRDVPAVDAALSTLRRIA